MKKITLKFLLIFAFLFSTFASAQCLEAIEGLYPSATASAAACDGITVTTITTLAYASEYSNVNVVAGETYTFRSSLATDYLTISNDNGVTASAFGVTPVTWVADITGVVRFYTHVDDLCGGNQIFRIKSFLCGIPPCIQPLVAFSKTFDCGSSTFEVLVDITDVGDATSITVSDDQGSASQTVASASLIIFGPYLFGTPVVLAATNDQTPICNVVSDVQIISVCPPLNDECAAAITINCGDVLTNQSTDGATGGTDTSCVGTIGDDIWYTFVGDGQIITVTATASVEFPQVEIYASTDGSCNGFAAGNCIASDGPGTNEAIATFASEIGTTYFMHIGNYINGSPAVVFDLAITCQEPEIPPANDACDGAFAVNVNSDLSCTSVTAGDLSGATGSSVSNTICFGTADDDIWFSFVATDTRHSVSLNNVVGSTTDLYHSLWSGDCTSLTLVPNSCSDANSSTPIGLSVGATYYIRVYSNTNAPLQTSTFNLCVGTLPPPPANDDCSGAIGITAGGQFSTSPVIGSTVSAITAAGLPTFLCQANRVNDVWYSVVVPASGNLIIETDAAPGTLMTDSVLSVYRGTCGSLEELGCDDDTGILNFSRVTLSGLTPNEILYIGVWRYSFGVGVDGSFQLSAYDPALLSNNTFEASSFKAFPNPVKNTLNLSYNKTISQVAVYNLLGQEVMTKTTSTNQSQIDMSNLASGTYLVKVTSENQIQTLKVIKD